MFRFVVPPLVVNIKVNNINGVDQSLMLECSVVTVRDISSGGEIFWMTVCALLFTKLIILYHIM